MGCRFGREAGPFGGVRVMRPTCKPFGMIWSKTRKALKALLADSVRGRVDYHKTRYGPGFSYLQTRAWVTWDGEEIATMKTPVWLQRQYELVREDGMGYSGAADRLRSAGVLSSDDFETAAEAYLGSSIDECLASDDQIVRAMAMFDRRLGKRRLLALQDKGDSGLVRAFYLLRMEAEGLMVFDQA